MYSWEDKMTTSVPESTTISETPSDQHRHEATLLIKLLQAWRDEDRDDQRETLELLQAELPANRFNIPEPEHFKG